MKKLVIDYRHRLRFFSDKNKPRPKIPQASAEIMVDLEDRFKDPFSKKEFLGVEMDYETRTFFKGLADQIGEDEVRDILERRYTVIDSGGALKEVDCSNTSINELPELPTELRNLICEDCSKLERLPELPAELMTIDISGTKISELPGLPRWLSLIDAENTPLAKNKELISRLQGVCNDLAIYD